MILRFTARFFFLPPWVILPSYSPGGGGGAGAAADPPQQPGLRLRLPSPRGRRHRSRTRRHLGQPPSGAAAAAAAAHHAIAPLAGRRSRAQDAPGLPPFPGPAAPGPPPPGQAGPPCRKINGWKTVDGKKINTFKKINKREETAARSRAVRCERPTGPALRPRAAGSGRRCPAAAPYGDGAPLSLRATSPSAASIFLLAHRSPTPTAGGTLFPIQTTPAFQNTLGWPLPPRRSPSFSHASASINPPSLCLPPLESN